ncbi:uncharacterized protein LOC132057744 [Lycium ferocissimum]|uniref:uncharacterized protein LOC132057744 n=1 Tax=Lycium ferocissimum TaxID=112874 RepID=UPI0028167672|nr:uncharacterized protein LOC132057744 [Lycium ferocissimum]
MLEARDATEREIWWEPRNGFANFWFDNWTKLGPLTQLMPANFPMNDSIQEVADLMENGKWSYQKLQQTVPKDIVDHIRKEVHIDTPSENMDKAWWMLTGSGKYTVSSAWEAIRQRSTSNWCYKQFWTKGLPFKIVVFLWRVWKQKLPVDDILAKMGISIVSIYIWKMFSAAAGVQGPFIQVNQAINKRWDIKCSSKLKPLYQAAPAIILWQL